MPIITPPQLTAPDADDPLGFGLKSLPEPLQMLWLIRARNPYFEAAVEKARPTFDIPTAGFTNAEDYRNWIVSKSARHGHVDLSEALTRHHFRNVSWPIHDSYLPGPCCSDDPLFVFAESLTVRFRIDSVDKEPGFENIRGAVVEYMLLNRWREERSTRDSQLHRGAITGRYHIVLGETAEVTKLGPRHRTITRPSESLYAGKGAGAKLPLWYEWWKLREEDMTVDLIAGIPVEESTGEHFYDERSVHDGIKRVEYLMTPTEILSPS